MYTNLYVYIALPIDMTGKLYWRIKKNGKWTWTAASQYFQDKYCYEHADVQAILQHSAAATEEE